MSPDVLYDDFSEESDANSVCADSDYMDGFPMASSVTMPWWGDEELSQAW